MKNFDNSKNIQDKIFLRGLINATLSSRVYLESIENLKQDLLNNPYEKKFNFTEEDAKNYGENYFLAKKLNAQLNQYFNPVDIQDTDVDKKIHDYNSGIYKLKGKELDINLKGLDCNNETRFSMGLFTSSINQDNTLHIVFRGTDPKFERKMLYFGYDYLNMERHYKAFEPLLQKALDYAEKNNIKNIDVAGHSLGGAMVDIFLRKNAERYKNKIEIKGYSFGNPYGYSSSLGMIQTVDACIDKLDNSKLSKFKAFQALGVYAASVSSISVIAKVAINYVNNITLLFQNTIEKLVFGGSEYNIDKNTKYVMSNTNSELTSFNHVSDPVVITGALAYETSGNRILLSDTNNLPEGKLNSINPVKHIKNLLNIFTNLGAKLFENHSMNNYMTAFINRTDNYIEKDTNIPFLKTVLEIKDEFNKHKDNLALKNKSKIDISNIVDKLRNPTESTNNLNLKNQ